MRISDWSSDVCSSDLYGNDYQSSSTTDYAGKVAASGSTSFGSLVPKVSKQVSSSTSNNVGGAASILVDTASDLQKADKIGVSGSVYARSEEHTSELQSLMRNSYDVFCLKQKKKQLQQPDK